MVDRENYVFVSYRELLTEEHLRALTYGAGRSYGKVWNAMRLKQDSVVTIENASCAERINLSMKAFRSAQDELENAGLLGIKRNARSRHGDNAAEHTQYRFKAWSANTMKTTRAEALA